LYLNRRVRIRAAEPVQATFVRPVYSIDSVVIPAGAKAEGHIVSLGPASKMRRTVAIVNGDFTSLNTPYVRFEKLILPGGQVRSVATQPVAGLPSVYIEPKVKKAKTPKRAKQRGNHSGVWTTAKDEVNNKINQQIAARTRGLAVILRGPGKWERLQEFMWQKLPYHPRWVTRGTRYDAILTTPLAFGVVTRTDEQMQTVGGAIPPDALVRTRMLTEVTSANARTGDTLEAVVTEPVFSPNGQLILPEGTHLKGEVSEVRKARYFQRGGTLRFRFTAIGLPEWAKVRPQVRQTAQVVGTEADHASNLQIDDEGGVKSSAPKRRLLAPAVATIIAMRAADNDAGKHNGTGERNTGGRALGGFSGLGVPGAVLGRLSPPFGTAMGFYGLGWSVWNHVIQRGQEVEFHKNTPVDVQFGDRVTPAKHLLAISAPR